MAKILEIFTLKTFVNQYDNDHTGLLAVSWIQPLTENTHRGNTRADVQTGYLKSLGGERRKIDSLSEENQRELPLNRCLLNAI